MLKSAKSLRVESCTESVVKSLRMDATEKEKCLQKASKLISSARDSMKLKDHQAALSFFEQGIEYYSDVLSCKF